MVMMMMVVVVMDLCKSSTRRWKQRQHQQHRQWQHWTMFVLYHGHNSRPWLKLKDSYCRNTLFIVYLHIWHSAILCICVRESTPLTWTSWTSSTARWGAAAACPAARWAGIGGHGSRDHRLTSDWSRTPSSGPWTPWWPPTTTGTGTPTGGVSSQSPIRFGDIYR